MDFECTLEILSDTEAVYQDDYYFKKGAEVRARTGGDSNELWLETAECFHRWVGEYDQCRHEELEILGHHLYNIAFRTPNSDSGDKRKRYPLQAAFELTFGEFEERKKQDASSRLRLKLVLHEEAERLSALPWEFIWMPGGDGFFLAGERTELILTRFVPNVDQNDGNVDSGDEELRILVVVSTPRELEIAEDADDVLEKLNELHPKHTKVKPFYRPTLTTLTDEINKFKPHIMHFIGHGEAGKLALFHEPEAIKAIELRNKVRKDMGQEPQEIKEAHWLGTDSVRSLFGGHAPRLVFLNACKGATTDVLSRGLRTYRSTARELVKAGISAVIAMQYDIHNDDAKRFASVFYDQIRQGMHIDEAVVTARRELGTKPPKSPRNWDDRDETFQVWNSRSFGTPVIYLQSEKPIIEPPSKPEPVVLKKDWCPYGNCPGAWIIPGRSFCPSCEQPVMECPECGVLMPQEKNGFCSQCGYKEGRDAKAARVKVQQPVVNAADDAIAQQGSPPGTGNGLGSSGRGEYAS